MRRMIRQWTAVILSLLLAAAAPAGMAEEASPAEAKRVTDIQKAVDEGGDKALWELVNTRYATNTYRETGCAGLYIWQPDGPAFPVRNTSDSHLLNFYTVAIQETAGVGFMLEQLLTYTVRTDGTCELTDSTESSLPNGPMRIAPYSTVAYYCAGAAVENARYEIIVAAGTDDNGHELEFYGVMQKLNVLPENAAGWYPASPDYDTDNLRYEAAYDIQVGNGVWWVPARALGGSRYTNREIAELLEHSPEQKQEEISTLYEALQLFEISGFTYSEDNVQITENGLQWEHHKPGCDAVRTNTGCCAASADWLNYILSGDYEETGFFGWSWPEGNGHVFNYIRADGWYYFIDLTHYEEGILTTESEDMRPYRYAEHPAGSLHRAKDPETFARYYQGTMSGNPPAVFEIYQAENVPPVSVTEEDGQLTIYYPEGSGIRTIDGAAPGAVSVEFIAGPEKTYRWAGLKSAKIKASRKHLRAANEASAEPLTLYRPGDRLTLEDHSEKGTAVIDGIKYGTSKRDEVRVSFEENVLLYGERGNGVFNLRLPLGFHGKAMEKMDSLELGDLTLDVVRTVPEVQVVICVREGDYLTVQEVTDGKYYDSRHIGIQKAADGGWADSPDYWYLIITRDRKIKYEFGRFFCSVSDEN